jgi:hypothetical protein
LTIFPNCRPVDVVCFGIDFGETAFHLVGLVEKSSFAKGSAVHFVVRPTRYAIETLNTLEGRVLLCKVIREVTSRRDY